MSTEAHKRRWFQFRLRTLLFVMAVVCISLGALHAWLHPYLQQRRALATIQSSDGHGDVGYSHQGCFYSEPVPGPLWVRMLFGDDLLFAKVDGICLLRSDRATDGDLVPFRDIMQIKILNLERAEQVSDAGLEPIAGLSSLVWLSLEDTCIGDVGLMHLANMTQLEELMLARTKVTGTGLAHLGNLTQLRELDLTGTPLTDEGLSHLPSLPRIEILSLIATSVTGPGLVHLARLPRLRTLNLSNAPLKREALESLKGLRQIEHLDITQTDFVEEDIEQLRHALPHLKITYWLGVEVPPLVPPLGK